ncbi:hypothetical protein SAMN04488020_101282 [Palleronia marisminoris]|uniref:Uncharacterized protein n=1 Tax=Palleronia marisminoris TaxID=315423 RepID=A0A1Y5RHE5_9RHOB|nr:hypothetical protein SAMN04488020_101282 [Palleronia marisminoris]SLN14746.1 hypothetical protein PAM7066_00283 [Palleronia marisminoris]
MYTGSGAPMAASCGSIGSPARTARAPCLCRSYRRLPLSRCCHLGGLYPARRAAASRADGGVETGRPGLVKCPTVYSAWSTRHAIGRINKAGADRGSSPSGPTKPRRFTGSDCPRRPAEGDRRSAPPRARIRVLRHRSRPRGTGSCAPSARSATRGTRSRHRRGRVARSRSLRSCDGRRDAGRRAPRTRGASTDQGPVTARIERPLHPLGHSASLSTARGLWHAPPR